MDDKKPPVLFFVENFHLLDGWGTCAVNIINRLRSRIGHGLIVGGRGAKADQPPYDFLRLYKPRKPGMVAQFLAIYCTLRARRRFKLIYCMVEPFLPLAYEMARLHRARLVVHIHGTHSVLPITSGLKSWYERIYQLASLVVSVSNYTKAVFKAEFPQINVVVRHIGVDAEKFPYLQVAKERFFIFVGDPKVRKGLTFALEAFSVFLQKNPGFEFLVTGSLNESERYDQEVLRLIAEKQIPVRFLGKVSQDALVRLYQSAYAQVLPSISEKYYFEGFGLVHLEANLCGTLSIGSKASANEEIIRDGINGFLAEQKNVESIAQAMANVVELVNKDPIGTSARCRLHAEAFTWNDAVETVTQEIHAANAKSFPQKAYPTAN